MGLFLYSCIEIANTYLLYHCRNVIRVIHPDKLRGASVAEQLEAKELFTVLNQAFEKFKNQMS